MRVAAINDLSGFGKCSLIADIAVLSAMGIEVCPVPTAVLTAQTGFPSFYMHDTGDMVEHSKTEWSKMGEAFDGVITGYIPNEQMVDSVMDFADSFNRKDTVLLVDPVMGDAGKCFPNFSEGLISKIKELSKKANVITPNLTELYLLAGEDPKKADISFTEEKDIAKIADIAFKVRANDGQDVVVTGIPGKENEVCNLVYSNGEAKVIRCKTNKRSYSGTGDLFAAVLMGNILNGKDTVAATTAAADFIGEAIDATTESDRNYGVSFEKVLNKL
ncbi:pyridoxamine kinase [Butyrivibrio sp. X503]|uniref:pyridoxamine kinase n=1 Tax=Butyrivibrio sp. X503 TaxID=2364878 RepID=UPI000EA8C3D3|nr:pyridoxamine kinase [Butyrivibrio sp. X503]RKM54110.1 pyridoxamine kinase [Butyrivibrio sp. X503]